MSGETEQAAAGGPKSTLLTQADDLYKDNKITECYDLLIAHKDSDNVEVLWRLARAATEKGKGQDDKGKKALTYEAFEHIKRALAIDESHPACHKWYAILLDYTGEYEGTKARITNAYQVKEHLLKAIELNPKDATTIHSLGYWCYVVADLPWVQQKVASVVYASPPKSSYDEALKYFLDAESVDPNFYSMNLVMIGRTYLALKDKAKAKDYLIRARDYQVKTEDDKKAHKESTEMLKKLGVKE